MSIGKRIRFIRNLKGMTQKYLGMRIGFSERTATIRMTQYENGTRTPKQDLINTIASQLDVSPSALNVPDIDSELGLIHTLFALEDMYGAKAKKIDGEIHICFNSNNTTAELYEGLSEWAKARELHDNNYVIKENYDTWRYNYPEYSIDDFDQINESEALKMAIDHRSYADQIPTIYEGYASQGIEACGGISGRAETNREIREKNNLLRQINEQLKELGTLLKESGIISPDENN